MSAFKKSRTKWGSKKLKRLMKRADIKIAPYRDKLESPDGMFARLYLSGIAAIVAEGKESHTTFKDAIVLASDMTDVPVSVMSAYGEVILAMASGSIQYQQTSPFVGSGKNVW